MNRVLPETESNLLLGILIGARKALPKEVIDNFNITGTSHIIAISGYNISIIATSLTFVSFYIGRKLNTWLILIIVCSFVIMSGASSSVVRAAIMGSLFLLAGRAGRLYAIVPSLCFAAFIMLLWNPYILYFDASFQLSFLATAGIVFIVPPLNQLFERLPKLFGVKEILITTFAAIVSTLPLILHTFGRLSLVAPLTNILILPFVPATMLFGFLIGLPIVGAGFGLLAHELLKYTLFITSSLAKMPYASTTYKINNWTTFITYGILIIALYLLHRFQNKPVMLK